jgi:hypothetical protein
MMMKRNYPEGDARREGSLEVNVKDQNMQDEHDVEGNTKWFLAVRRCGIMQTIVVGDDMKG